MSGSDIFGLCIAFLALPFVIFSIIIEIINIINVINDFFPKK